MKYDTGARKYKRTQSGIALRKSLSNLEISMGTHLPHLYCLYLGQAYTAHCFLLSSKPNCCCSWIHYCSVPCRFCIWNATLGLWYLGPILNPYCWPNLNQKFQNASCWSSRYHQAWICRNKCELMLSNAFLHLFWVIFETRINIPTIVLMDYNIRCSVRNSDELDP